MVAQCYRVWCATQTLAQTGAEICGYPAGYAGTYYAITAAGAAALGRPINGFGDCATNYYSGNGIQGWNGSACWTPAQEWARNGSSSNGQSVGGNVVRCTNLELPAGCVRAADKTVWCATQTPTQTGAESCGYPAGYAGTYYAITAAGAAALGRSILGYGDCATNYYTGGQIQGWNGSACWTPAAQWARNANNGAGQTPGGNVVRCINRE